MKPTVLCSASLLLLAPVAADDARAFPAAARAQRKLLYISCGNQDGLISISQGVHRHLQERDVPHLWNVDDHGHDAATWGSNLYHFAQRLFR